MKRVHIPIHPLTKLSFVWCCGLEGLKGNSDLAFPLSLPNQPCSSREVAGRTKALYRTNRNCTTTKQTTKSVLATWYWQEPWWLLRCYGIENMKDITEKLLNVRHGAIFNYTMYNHNIFTLIIVFLLSIHIHFPVHTHTVIGEWPGPY